MKNLSDHFTYEEFTRTQTMFPNVPNDWQLSNLTDTARKMEGVRSLLLNRPIIINSAFRSPEVNQAVRGVTRSAHCDGYAVDFTGPDFGSNEKVAWEISSSPMSFDQLILEGVSPGWVHISFDPRFRRQILTATFINGKATYEHGLK